MTTANSFVTYYRCSTSKQEKSGLGLEAQQAAVASFIGAGKVVASYTEIESGRNNERPKIAQAIAHAKRSKARLVIAKLDRLARDVHFTSGLLKAGVDFVAVDMPFADKFTIHVIAAVAEKEAEDISKRTKAGLAALKARGVKLGAHRPGAHKLTTEAMAVGRKLGSEWHRERAVQEMADLLPRMTELRQAGQTLQQICDTLNAEGQTTRGGTAWTPTQVRRVLVRAGK